MANRNGKDAFHGKVGSVGLIWPLGFLNQHSETQEELVILEGELSIEANGMKTNLAEGMPGNEFP